MIRRLFYILGFLLLLIALIIVGGTAAVTIYEDKIKAILSDKIYQSTGRAFEIADGFQFTLNPRPTLVVKDIRFANADWGSEPWMLTIGRAEASLSLEGLLKGELRLRVLALDSPNMLIEKKEGKNNWLFRRGKSTATRQSFDKLAQFFYVKQAEIKSGVIRMNINSRKHQLDFDEIVAETHSQNRDILVDARGHTEGKPFELSGVLSDFATILKRQPTQLSAKATLGDTQLAAVGTVADVMRWQGLDVQIEASAPTIAVVQPWLKPRVPNSPPFKLTARFLQPQRWYSGALESIRWVSEGGGGMSDIQGRVAAVWNLSGADLKGTIDYSSQEFLQWLGFSPLADARLQGNVELTEMC